MPNIINLKLLIHSPPTISQNSQVLTNPTNLLLVWASVKHRSICNSRTLVKQRPQIVRSFPQMTRARSRKQKNSLVFEVVGLQKRENYFRSRVPPDWEREKNCVVVVDVWIFFNHFRSAFRVLALNRGS